MLFPAFLASGVSPLPFVVPDLAYHLLGRPGTRDRKLHLVFYQLGIDPIGSRSRMFPIKKTRKDAIAQFSLKNSINVIRTNILPVLEWTMAANAAVAPSKSMMKRMGFRTVSFDMDDNTKVEM